MGRRFPPRVGRRHWRGVIVTDATGQETAYVYLEDEPGRRSAAQARRIAINVAKSGDSSCRSSNTISPRHRVHHLVPLGHDQRRLALLVHAAEPAHVKNLLPLLPVTDAIGLAYLHRTPQRGQGSPSPGITIGFRLFMSP